METPISNYVRRTGRYVTLFTLALVLTACGGSGGETDNPDFDGDGDPDATDPDADGDGTIDAFDSFVDLNGDGFDDVTGLTQAEAEAEDTEEVAATECDPESGTVAFGQTPSWNSNCTVRRSSIGGEFADSLYSVGIQRIVFCSGFGTAVNDDYRLFADGEYGPASEAATEEFQASGPNAVIDDGIVGPNTWAKLQDAMIILELGARNEITGEVTPDIYGFGSGRCADIPLFHQELTYDATRDELVQGGWLLTRNTPNENQTVPFSIDQPFGRL